MTPLLFSFLALINAQALNLQEQANNLETIQTPKEIVLSLVDKYSDKYKVSKTDMIKVLECENRDFVFDLQSYHIKDGKRERSFGVAQWNLDYNPDITYEQAIDPDYSIERMARYFRDGLQGRWSCWK